MLFTGARKRRNQSAFGTLGWTRGHFSLRGWVHSMEGEEGYSRLREPHLQMFRCARDLQGSGSTVWYREVRESLAAERGGRWLEEPDQIISVLSDGRWGPAGGGGKGPVGLISCLAGDLIVVQARASQIPILSLGLSEPVSSSVKWGQ